MAGLILKNINKTYPGGHQVIGDLDLTVEDGEFLVLAGPEGCGKSILLRMIAGFEEPTYGSVMIGGEDVTGTDPRGRNLAMLFRNSVLYPAMSVAENLSLSLRMARTAPGEAETRLRDIAERLDLTDLLGKMPAELTKEETVRALLGRALVRRPGLLLVDSPQAGFGEAIQSRLDTLGVTVIYAAGAGEVPTGIGSRLILMNDGIVCQDGSPQEVYDHPASLFAVRFFGNPPVNLVPGTVFGEENRVGLELSRNRLMLPDDKGRILAQSGYFGKEVLLAVRPEDIRPATGKEKENVIEGTLQGMELYGNRPLLHFSVGDLPCSAFADGMPSCGIGGKFRLAVDTAKAHIFDPETEIAIAN